MSEGIVYQNKDILFKILGQTYKEKVLRHMALTCRRSGNCFPQTCRRLLQMKKALTTCFCWKMAPMRL